MRAALILALCGILAVVTQTTLLGRLAILPAPPNLILILTVYIGLRLPNSWGAVGAFLLGYLLDTFSGSVPGLHCFTMTLVFAMVYFVSCLRTGDRNACDLFRDDGKYGHRSGRHSADPRHRSRTRLASRSAGIFPSGFLHPRDRAKENPCS